MNKEKRNIIIGNVTTVANSIIVIVGGFVFNFLLTVFGVLPFTQIELTSFLSVLVFGAFSIINAKYHNTFWNNEEDTITIDIDKLNDQQLKALQNFINYCTSNEDKNTLVRNINSQLDQSEISSSTEELEDETGDDENAA